MKRYTLAEHVFCAVDAERVIVLDVNRNRYKSVDACRLSALAKLVDGWPSPATIPEDSKVAPGEEAVEFCLKQGWLSETVAESRGLRNGFIEPKRDLGPTFGGDSARTSCALAAKAALASVHAKWMKRTYSFRHYINRVSQRKARYSHPENPDTPGVESLAAIYSRVQPFLYSAATECQYDCMARLEFLAHFHVFPDWIFAVRGRPFAAHCYLQFGDLILNDNLERARRFVPILRV